MVPGKTHISLTVAWALDHDPVAAVKLASNRDAIPEDEAVDLHAGDQVTPPPPRHLARAHAARILRDPQGVVSQGTFSNAALMSGGEGGFTATVQWILQVDCYPNFAASTAAMLVASG